MSSRTKRTITLLFTIVAAPLLAFAAPTTLDEARALALRTDRSVQKAELSLRSSLLDRESAIADFYPSVSATGSLSGGYPANDAGPLDWTSGVGLSLTQTIFSGGEKLATLRKISRQNLQAEAALKSARIAALKALDAQYIDVLEKQEKRNAAEKDLEASTKQMEIAEAKYSSGILDRAGYLESKSTLAGKKTAAVQAAYNLSISRVKLASLIGTKTDPEVVPLDRDFFDRLSRFFRDTPNENVTRLIGELYGAGRRENPDIRMKELEIDAAKFAVDVRKAAFLPSVSLSWSHTWTNSQFGPLSDNGVVKLSGSVPIFPYQNKAAGVKQAENTVESDQLSLDAQVEDFRLTLNSTILDLISAAHGIESARTAFSFAQEHYEQVFEKFRLSSATVSDLYQAEALLDTNRTTFITSSYSFYQSWTVLVYLLGFEKESSLLDIVKKAGFS